MVWYMGLAAFLLLWASQAMAHELTLLDDRRSTPDLRLELTELPSHPQPLPPPGIGCKRLDCPVAWCLVSG